MKPVPLATRLELTPKGTAIVHAQGDIDLASSDAFRAALANALEQSATIAVDMSEVGYIDSSGLSTLVWGHRETTSAGGSLTLRRPSRILRRLLDITGLASLLMTEDEPGRP